MQDLHSARNDDKFWIFHNCSLRNVDGIFHTDIGEARGRLAVSAVSTVLGQGESQGLPAAWAALRAQVLRHWQAASVIQICKTELNAARRRRDTAPASGGTWRLAPDSRPARTGRALTRKFTAMAGWPRHGGRVWQTGPPGRCESLGVAGSGGRRAAPGPSDWADSEASKL